MATNNWTKDQTIVALNIYCKIPFNRVSSTHPDVIKYAKIIGRSANALKMKIGNFGSFDPELRSRGIVGLVNVSRLDEEVWNEYNVNWEKLAIDSAILIAKFSNESLEKYLDSEVSLDHEFPEGKEKEVLIKARINQSFFRSTILSSYNSKCCITGLSIPSLLVASHIIPWSINSKERLNPRNGLCLNSIHDKAFDIGLIGIDEDYKIKISNTLANVKNDPALEDFLIKYKDSNINLPDRFVPNKDFLSFHYKNIFKK